MDFQYDFDEKGFAIIPAVLSGEEIVKLALGFACADVRRGKGWRAPRP